MRLKSLGLSFLILGTTACAHLVGPHANSKETLPSWVTRPPSSPGVRFYVGESGNASSREDAMMQAKGNGMFKIGLIEFPEVAQLNSQSLETMRSITYRRQFVLRLNLIDWTGLSEATESGSPIVTQLPSGEHKAFILLRWNTSELQKERQRLKDLRRKSPSTFDNISSQRRSKEGDFLIQYADRPESFEGFNYSQIQHYPKVRVGMSKADFLSRFGPPEAVRAVRMPHYGFWGTEGIGLYYRGKVCNDQTYHDNQYNMTYELYRNYLSAGECAVGIVDGEVAYIQNFHFNYTEVLQ